LQKVLLRPQKRFSWKISIWVSKNKNVMLISNLLMPTFKMLPKKIKSWTHEKMCNNKISQNLQEKTVHFQTFWKKVKCYFWQISIIPSLIPSEMSKKYKTEAPLMVCSVWGCWDRAQTVETSALAVRCYNHLARSHPET
jgi:hypothetical protein